MNSYINRLIYSVLKVVSVENRYAILVGTTGREGNRESELKALYFIEIKKTSPNACEKVLGLIRNEGF